jgi:hypothetical protein
MFAPAACAVGWKSVTSFAGFELPK